MEVAMMNAIMLNIVMLIVMMLSAVAPIKGLNPNHYA
jgi:hypothetical protein